MHTAKTVQKNKEIIIAKVKKSSSLKRKEEAMPGRDQSLLLGN